MLSLFQKIENDFVALIIGWHVTKESSVSLKVGA